MYALRHRCHSCLSCCCPADQERHYLLQRTRFLIDQVSSAGIWRLLPYHADDLSLSCKKCSRRLMAGPYICVPSRIVLRIIACHNEKSCSIRNPNAIRVDMHLMRMPAPAASPDHPHHTMVNCALLASAFTNIFDIDCLPVAVFDRYGSS